MATFGFLAFLFLLLPSLASGQNSEDICKKTSWLRLLHHRSSYIGPKSGRIADTNFYLHPKGAQDACLELGATLDHLKGNRLLKGKPPGCWYPQRLYYLKQQGFDLPTPHCPEFETWFKALGANQVSYVFAAAYANKIASMFGHSLLRFDKTNDNGRGPSDILSYGVNYGALVDPTDLGITYAFKGLFGGYGGAFGMAPYYMKINEYSHVESRDLWEYQLDLTQEEVESLVRHFWELRAFKGPDYLFLTRNCSTQMLYLLETVREDVNLVKPYDLYQLPSETVTRLREAGLIRASKYRPSLLSQYLHSRSRLSDTERLLLADWQSSENLPEEASRPALETLVKGLNYHRFNQKGVLSSRRKHQFQEGLVKLAGLPKTTATFPPLQAPYEPANAQPPRYLNVAAQVGEDGSEHLLASLRLGVHNLMDQNRGHEPTMQMEFGVIQAKYNLNNEALDLDKVVAADLINLKPIERVVTPSWQFRLLWQRGVEGEDPPITKFRVGGGLARGYSYRHLAWILSGMEARASMTEATIGPYAWVGYILNLSQKAKLHLGGDFFYDLRNQEVLREFEAQGNWYLAENHSIRLRLEVAEPSA